MAMAGILDAVPDSCYTIVDVHCVDLIINRLLDESANPN